MKFAVIFRFTYKYGKSNDSKYLNLSEDLNLLVMDQEGFIDVVDYSNDTESVSISYWENMEAIQNWAMDPDHILAKKYGKDNIYDTYSVEICEIKRAY